MTDALTWQPIEDALPEAGKDVLLLWTWPGVEDVQPIHRIGKLGWKPFLDDKAIWIFNLDCGDASASIFSHRDDDQPTHWMPLPAAPTGAA